MTYLAILLAALLSASSHAAEWGRVIDGDSFKIGPDEIRLYGVDAPEHNQPYGTEAKQALIRNAHGKPVRLDVMGTDRYDRVLAIVRYMEGRRTLQGVLVAAGYAWVDNRYCKRRECRDWRAMQWRAKSKKRGLWAASNPVPPWEWRHR